MSLSCYVYYRIEPERHKSGRDAVERTIDCLRKRAGVTARLMIKTDDPSLWMEVYEGIGDEARFLTSLRECVEASGLLSCLASDSERHIEMFRCA